MKLINNVKERIYTIRGLQVMLDRDLSELYQVSAKRLNEQVKRNIERFPDRFMFQLTESEYSDFLRSQNATLETGKGKHRKYLPYVFTEQGVSMLASVLRSKIAISVSIQIIDAFVSMRKFLTNNANIFERMDKLEIKQIEYQLKTDESFEKVFKAIEDKNIKPNKGIFYNGQIFDAYKFVSDLIKSCKKSIILIDNFIDESVLVLFSKRNKNTDVIIYTNNISDKLKLDLKKFNSQYSSIEIKEFKNSHDRFLILDEKEVYHFGASLKDLGKKWFAFSKFNKEAIIMFQKLPTGQSSSCR